MTQTHIVYFKRQAKNLFKDYQTQTSYINNIDGNTYYKYDPRYFDIDSIFLDFKCSENDFCLMKAQHIIARMIGFYNWADLLKANIAELELAKLLFDNQDKIFLEDWKTYISSVETGNKLKLDSESKLEIFKHVFLIEDSFENPFPDYRLK
jgi:hypothetical protein